MEAEKTSPTESYIALTDIYICVWLKTAFHNIFKGDNRARRSEQVKCKLLVFSSFIEPETLFKFRNKDMC